MAEWHLITSEYPPQSGGVSDYSYVTATGLAVAGDAVHVWCPPCKEETPISQGVTIHREIGRMTPKDLRGVSRMLDGYAAPHRLLVQWVPHGYGYRSMNLPFCLWLWHRAVRKGDEIDLMIHEPFLAFGEGSWRQNLAAVVHRAMTIVLLRSARRLWFSIPSWESRLRPYALGRAIPSTWLPVCSNIPLVDDPVGVSVIRNRYAPAGELLVGHLGTYGDHISKLLMASLPTLLRQESKTRLLLLGHGGQRWYDQLIDQNPDLKSRVDVTGTLDASALSRHVSACDLMLQPYPDGISTRRTSAMVGLSHGRAMLTTTGQATEPIWEGSGAVVIAPFDDPVRLLEVAKSVLSSGAERERLGHAAQGLYKQKFDYSHMISALREC